MIMYNLITVKIKPTLLLLLLDMNPEDKIEKNLIGSRTCFSTNPNEEGWGKKHQPIYHAKKHCSKSK